jgi:hypothetical protein
MGAAVFIVNLLIQVMNCSFLLEPKHALKDRLHYDLHYHLQS